MSGSMFVFRVVNRVEKPAPAEAPSNLAIAGRYIFSPVLFDMIRRVKPDKRGEIQLTDAIQFMCDEGRRVMDQIMEGLIDHCKVESPARMEGKRMVALLAPKAGTVAPKAPSKPSKLSSAGRSSSRTTPTTRRHAWSTTRGSPTYGPS